MYRVVVLSCPDAGLGNVRLTSAYVIAENPYGFLPGDIYPLYPVRDPPHTHTHTYNVCFVGLLCV